MLPVPAVDEDVDEEGLPTRRSDRRRSLLGAAPFVFNISFGALTVPSVTTILMLACESFIYPTFYLMD